MPQLIPTKLFLKDVEQFRADAILRKKIAIALFCSKMRRSSPACIWNESSMTPRLGRPGWTDATGSLSILAPLCLPAIQTGRPGSPSLDSSTMIIFIRHHDE